MVRLNALPLYFFNEIYFSKHREKGADLFYKKNSYKTEKANEADALKSRSWSASFPCLRGAPNGR